MEYKKSLFRAKVQTNKILTITELLLDCYSFSTAQTYPRPNHPIPEKRKDVYFTMVAILLSLRTTLENEQKATKNFLKFYQTPQDVLNSTIEKLAEVIHTAGMPKKKAVNIIHATKYVVEKLKCDFEQFRCMPIADARNELKKIPGIGEKSADCILELGLDLPTIVIDINMLRVVSRVFNLPFVNELNQSNKQQLESAKKVIEENLPRDGFLYKIVHTMLLLHGKNTCKSKPLCEQCMIEKHCDYRKTSSGIQQKFDFSR